MLEIKFTFDATSELLSALRDIAGAIHCVSCPVTPLASDDLRGDQSTEYGNADTREENDDVAKSAQNLTAEPPVDAERTEAIESTEAPKKRKPRAKKAPSERNTPVAPAVGDNSSPDGEADPKSATAIETPSEPEPAPVVEDPAPVDGAVSFACASYIGARVSGTPATGPAPEEEATASQAEEEATASPAEDPLSGKGQTGEILAELTRKAIRDLDELGVDRGDANRRIRDYCARNEIKFPTFPALLNAVGYAEAIEICKGAMK